MKKLNREALKAFFKTGSRPSEAQFSDLIDSALIMEDEGFHKTADDGLQIITKGDRNALLTFGRSSNRSAWGVGFGDGTGDMLELRRNPRDHSPENPPLVALRKGSGDSMAQAAFAADVAIGERRDEKGNKIPPQSALDVRGTVRSDGRIGREVIVAADGDMHDITEALYGCVAFEIIAGVGLPGSGRYALMHAVAMNVYNPSPWKNLFGLKNRIRCQHAFYRRRSDRLILAWGKPKPPEKDIAPASNARRADDPNSLHGRDARYVLKIGTRTSFDGQDVKIKAFVTQLWYPDFLPHQKTGAMEPGSSSSNSETP